MTMRNEVVCGIDVGSTNTKLVAVAPDGEVVFRTASRTPRHADGMLHAPVLLDTVESALARLGERDHVIAAVCTAGVGEDGLLVGPENEALCDVLPWYHPERHRVFHRMESVIHDDPTLPVSTDPARTIVGWRWAREQPHAHLARSWCALADWMAASWARRAFMSDTLAARTAAWRTDTSTWDVDRVSATLGDLALLPEVVPAGRIVGRLHSHRLTAAAVLSPDAVVVAGGHDHPLGAWAIRRLAPTAVVDSMGTAEVIVAQSPRTHAQRTPLLDVGPGIQGSGSTILAVQELTRNIAWAEQDPNLRREIRRLVAGEVRPTPDLDDDTFRPAGMLQPEPEFSRSAPSEPLRRASAVLGRLARGGEELLDAAAATLDCPPVWFATGGWARSAGWMAIKEQVTGRSFHQISEPEVAAVGAALLAGTAIGWTIPAERVLGEPRPT